MIKSYTNGEWKEPGSLCQAVGIYKEDFHKVVSVVGGGGKTTVIRTMLRECMETCAERIPCAVSTTTHIQKINAEYFLGEPSMKMFRQKLADYGAVWMGREIQRREIQEGKLAAFPVEFLEEICGEPVLLLLEADGAKHFPVKAPAGHEPVIYDKTDIVLNVYGMSAVGRKIKDVCFRVREVEKILGKTAEDVLCPEDIMTLAVSRNAGRKCVTDEMEYQLVLNQADTEEQKQMAMQLAEEIEKKLSEMYTKDTAFQEQISKVHVTSDLIPVEERW